MKKAIYILLSIICISTIVNAQSSKIYNLTESSINSILGYWSSEKIQYIENGTNPDAVLNPNPKLFFTISRDLDGIMFFRNYNATDFRIITIKEIAKNQFSVTMVRANEYGEIIDEFTNYDFLLIMKGNNKSNIIDKKMSVFNFGTEIIEIIRLEGPK